MTPEFVTPLDMLADKKQLVREMRRTHALCDDY